MPDRDRKRVYDELNGFRMAVQELNRELATESNLTDAHAEAAPLRLTPPKRRGDTASEAARNETDISERFIRDGADVVAKLQESAVMANPDRWQQRENPSDDQAEEKD